MNTQENKFEFLQFHAYMLLGLGYFLSQVDGALLHNFFGDPLEEKMDFAIDMLGKVLIVFFLGAAIYVAFRIKEKKIRYVQLSLCVLSVISVLVCVVLSKPIFITAVLLIVMYGISCLSYCLYVAWKVENKTCMIIQYCFVFSCLIFLICSIIFRISICFDMFSILVYLHIIVSYAYWWYTSYKK